jgi:iron complex transport system ATP-binding protein
MATVSTAGALEMIKDMTTEIYRVNDVDFTYPGGKKKVLDGVNLTLDSGEILCILGPNGAGKSTLLSCLDGLLKPQHGEIILGGKDLRDLSVREIAKAVAFVPQSVNPAFDYSVLDYVIMGRAPNIGMLQRPGDADIAVCVDALKSLSIEHLATKSYMEISGGERQQVTIARAIAQNPKVILFDEPTAHLDYGNQHRVLLLIRSMCRRGYSVVITTHNPDHALLLGGKVAILNRDGKLKIGSPDVIVTERYLREIYQTDIRVAYIESAGRIVCTMPVLENE